MARDIKEIALKTGRGAIGIVPGGSLVAEFFETPKEKRLDSYLNALDVLVKKIESEHGIESASLAQRDDFLDVLFGCTSVWLVNSNEVKLKAVLALLENVAINPDVDSAIDSMVLRFLRDLSGSHLYLVLKMRADKNYIASPEFREKLENTWTSKWGIVHNDLANLGIIELEELSSFGKRFADRITVKSVGDTQI